MGRSQQQKQQQLEEHASPQEHSSDVSSTDSSSSGYFSYVEGGCYFPYGWGIVSILYILTAIIVSSISVPKIEEQDAAATSSAGTNNVNVIWQSMDIFLSILSAFMAIHLFVKSSLTVSISAALLFGGWTVGFVLRSFLHSGSMDEESGIVYIVTATIHLVFALAMAWLLALLSPSWEVVATAKLAQQQQQQRQQQQQPYTATPYTPLLSWMNAAYAFASIVLLGTAVIWAAAGWAVAQQEDNTSNNAFTPKILLQIGQVLFVTGYLLILVAAALIWGFQAHCQVVYLPDFFLPPSTAASMILWCAIFSAVYRIVLVALPESSDFQIHEHVAAPILLNYCTVTTLCACHNLILSFFPSRQWNDYDEDDQLSQEDERLQQDDVIDRHHEEPDEGNDDDIESIGYHYELEQNSIHEGHVPVQGKDISKPFPNTIVNRNTKRVLRRKGQEEPKLSDTIQIMQGGTDEDDDDDNSTEVYEYGRPHVYGKYDDWVFGEDVDRNTAMVDIEHQPPRRFFEPNEEEEMDEDGDMHTKALEFMRTLSILPTSAPDRDDDQTIETTEASEFLRQSTQKNLSTMEGGKVVVTHNNPSVKAALADFLCVLAPQMSKRNILRGAQKSQTTQADMEEKPATNTRSPRNVQQAIQTLEEATTIDPCNSGLEEIHRNIQAVSSTFSEKASNTLSLASSTDILEQVSSAWTSWMANDVKPSTEPTTRKEQKILPPNVQVTTIKDRTLQTGKQSTPNQHTTEIDVRQLTNLDTISLADSDESPIPIRDIVINPKDEGSLCFQEDEIGSAINDAIMAQYLQHPYVNGQRELNNSWDDGRRGRSKSRRLLSLSSLAKSRASSREAERDRKKHERLARSLSRERSKNATKAKGRRSSRRQHNDDNKTHERKDDPKAVDERAVVDAILENANVLIHQY
ncbi:hypothetical protein IV203_006374 [Nitzschia inconspicua]|uniref:Uncharacterized protein n=1 Tax=Nitzschia inconspicua TaxID=303405 RepID=A0A9K3K5I1_9STRA|nr:hypothetical protein IV203_006600 [Nitzschia inconspicua]KAG7339971.1 hypothetical protein IV203_006374 [Nitzschia inconspicua]